MTVQCNPTVAWTNTNNSNSSELCSYPHLKYAAPCKLVNTERQFKDFQESLVDDIASKKYFKLYCVLHSSSNENWFVIYLNQQCFSFKMSNRLQLNSSLFF